MHANIGEALKIHFKLNDRWWVSSKNVLQHLDEWDSELAELVKEFISSAEPKEKFGYWSTIIDHITAQMGGRSQCQRIIAIAKYAQRIWLTLPKKPELNSLVPKLPL